MIKKIICSTLLVMAILVSNGQTILKLKKEGGIYLVPCKINGLDFDLYFDTGASLVSLSLKEAKKLVDLGKLKKEDIIGRTQMTIANGQFINGTIILIKELRVGDLLLKDIEAVITETQTAPLLLGQSAISKFGEFTFDYTTQTLKINKTNNNPYQATTPIIKAEYKTSLSPEQVSAYEDFLKNKLKIVEAIHVDLLKYQTEKTLGGFNRVRLVLETSNNSDYDFTMSKQMFANPIKCINVVVTVFTTEGKSYTEKQKLADIFSHDTKLTSLDIVTAYNNISGIKIRVMDLDF